MSYSIAVALDMSFTRGKTLRTNVQEDTQTRKNEAETPSPPKKVKFVIRTGDTTMSCLIDRGQSPAFFITSSGISGVA
ncbi:hypothetical protein TNCV_2183522 [Trichonephila clavipes]|nr:hypothetical protein TNCV_2183522 [Trichonephila clavipes]